MRTIAALAILLATPVTATASGGAGPLPAFGGAGASAPGGEVTYVAMPGFIQEIRRETGAVERWRGVSGTFGVPLAAFDGSTTGLSADGRTLVLAELTNNYPPQPTRLRVVDTKTLRTRARVTLPGYSSVDAVSPDGRWVYLVRYTDPLRDPSDYEVRAYDLVAGRLHPEPVVDPEEPEEQMGGMPYARATSADGRWAYTLYAAEEPFIHALDTVGRTAKCIDLPQFAGEDISALKLRFEAGALHVDRASGANAATVDLETFVVGKPRAASAPSRPAPPKEDTPWAAVGIGLAAVGALGAVAARRRSRERVAA